MPSHVCTSRGARLRNVVLIYVNFGPKFPKDTLNCVTFRIKMPPNVCTFEDGAFKRVYELFTECLQECVSLFGRGGGRMEGQWDVAVE